MSTPKAYFGILSLLVAIVALGLAIIPQVHFSEVQKPKAQPEVAPEEIREGGKTIEWKGMKLTFGGKVRRVNPPPAPPPPPPSPWPKYLYTASISLALVGIFGGVVACWREQSKALGAPAVVLCALAITWPYFVLGITWAITIVVLLLILAIIAQFM